MRSRKLLALIFSLLAIAPALAGYMTLLGAGVGSIQPVASWVSTTDPTFPSSSLTFSRTSLATMFDSTGKLTYAPNNLLTYSNTFSNAVWNQNATVSIAGGVSDPVGGSAASTVTATANNAVLGQGVVVGASLPGFTVGIWARRRTGSGAVYLYGPDSNAPGRYAMALSSSWQFFPNSGASNGDTKAYLVLLFATSGDAIDVYAGVLSRVTYETSPRAADQVITTSSAYYGPRIDYDPNTLAVKGLLPERQSTNNFFPSTPSGWTPSGASVGAGATSVDGISAMMRITEDGTTAAHAADAPASSYSIVSGQTYTVSFDVKNAVGSRWLQFNFSGSGIWGNFNPSTGATGSSGGVWQSAISLVTEALGSYGYRCKLTFTASSTQTPAFRLYLVTGSASTNAQSYTGDGSSAIDVSWIQFENQPFATSRIKTTTAGVTRAPDTFTFIGPAATALSGAQGAYAIETGPGSQTNFANAYILYQSGNYLTAVSNTQPQFVSTIATIGGAGNFTTGNVRTAVSWSAAASSTVANGGTVANGSAHTPSGSAYLGSNGAGAFTLDAPVRSFAIYNQRLPDATLQAKSVVGASYAANDNGLRFADNDNLPIHWRVAL